ncbi:MAG: C40 family peptidase [Hyphomicrobiales bacterium]|nr:C40 family peptidase [Hyphomicrobiales bacterium]
MTTGQDFDKRLMPARPDIAAAHLRGKVKARHYVEGRSERVLFGTADMRGEPSPGASVTTQALRGENVQVYEVEEGWAWCQLETDGYVGYLPAAALAPRAAPPSHRVRELSTFLYPGPSMKLPVAEVLPLNARLTITGTEGHFARVENEGYVWASHIVPVEQTQSDFVTVAERFLGVPYLWGGKTSHGLDCSGLVQTALAAAGVAAPRDTDMQEAGIGVSIAAGADVSGDPGQWNIRLQRGDLIFWRGHVGIMIDTSNLLHANGHHMLVATEPLDQAVARIADNSYGAVTSIRRM